MNRISMKKGWLMLAMGLILVQMVACMPLNEQSKENKSSSVEVDQDVSNHDVDQVSMEEESKKFKKSQWKTFPTVEQATFVRMVDGDTMIVKLEGSQREERLRLLMIDTPECVHEDPEKNGRFGEMASEFAKALMEERIGKNGTVYLVKDVSDRDQYGRLLRYVFLKEPKKDDVLTWLEDSLNAIMLYEGYANVVTFPPDVSQKDFFLALSKDARKEDRGLYALTDVTNLKKAQALDKASDHGEDQGKKTEEGDVGDEVTTMDGDELAFVKAEGRIIGNKKSKYYHLPDGEGYKKVKAKNAVYFDTEEEAIKAGYRKGGK
ncbi:MAG: thermonuclease family protein [Tissierellia bacterium]|nr:thermonuclease family protein [Tissierellia bacterium]